MFSFRSKYSSHRDLLAADAKAALADSELDDQLWLLLCDQIRDPKDLAAFSPAVAVYYSSRLLQWEVGNGGFAQAADNIPEWFSHAAAAYEVLGRGEFADLIRKALAVVRSNSDDMEELQETFEELDGELASLDWQIDEARVAYVRQQRDAFIWWPQPQRPN